MALRVIEIIIPRADREAVVDAFEEQRSKQGWVYWTMPLEADDALSVRIVLDVQESENVLDKLEKVCAGAEQYRIVVYSAQATLPRLDVLAKAEEKEKEEEAQGEKEDGKEAEKTNRISREELYADVLDTTVLTPNYVMLVLFSSLVAIIGLMRDSVTIIIGAMVLAPLLGPNVGLSLATTLGDFKLTRESIKTLAVGVLLSFLLATAVGFSLGLPDMTGELLARSVTGYSDLILAMVAGAAGIISVTLGVPTSLVGVMVALSLLPPLTACGLFFGAGMLPKAGGAALLFLSNVICLNLAGVGTFLVQGIRPLSWWEKKKAKKATVQASIVWVALLVLLIWIISSRVR